MEGSSGREGAAGGHVVDDAQLVQVVRVDALRGGQLAAVERVLLRLVRVVRVAACHLVSLSLPASSIPDGHLRHGRHWHFAARRIRPLLRKVTGHPVTGHRYTGIFDPGCNPAGPEPGQRDPG